MNYALASIWHDKARYLPGIFAVSFSAVLMALQCGLLLGLFSVTSIPIDNSRADIWVGSPRVLSVDLGRPIPVSFIGRIAPLAGVAKVEPYYQAFANWTKPGKGTELCIVIGSDLEPDTIGANKKLTPELLRALTEPGGIVVDVSEKNRLKVSGVGDTAEINHKPVRIVGFVEGFQSLAGPYVFASETTARDLLSIVMKPGEATYLLVRVENRDDIPRILEDLAQYDDMSAFESEDFAFHSKKHWLLKTKAGIAIGYAALLGLLVGMVVTSQTLYAATSASAKEYAILLAMGIPRRRITSTVLVQSFWIGLVGLLVSYPIVLGLKELAALASVRVDLVWQILTGTAVVTMVMAMVSGFLALRSVAKIEPMSLLR